MKAFLLYRDRDCDIGQNLPPGAADAARDLEVETVLDAMAGEDEFLLGVVRSVMHASLSSPDDIVYRQDILADSLRHPDVVSGIYAIATETIEAERRHYRSAFSSPGYVLSRATKVLRLQVAALRRLREIGAEQRSDFRSAGFTRFFEMLASELGEDFLSVIEAQLRQLRFRGGVLVSARLGPGNLGVSHVLRRPGAARARLLDRLPGMSKAGLVLTVADRDVTGRRTLTELSGRGIAQVADALTESADHIQDFLTVLRQEVGFYIGCLCLHSQLTDSSRPLCVPVPVAAGKQALAAHGLCDAGLALVAGQPQVVGNDVEADGKSLVIITGANQGGKSTFLRSIGLAQLMMQCGMFVCAQSYTASAGSGLFTHYQREEDAAMVSGKLDEELSRMSAIVSDIRPDGLLLCNESFAATNEREGSQIARHVIRALAESGVRVFFVTHFFDLADGFFREAPESALFLRAERCEDGRRTFRLVPGRPLPTSHARDVYEHVFAREPEPVILSGGPGYRAPSR